MTRAKDELYIFDCADKPGEFGTEVSGRIPAEDVDSDDVFAPFKTSLCGKSYSHREKGRGIIRAQCGDRLLVCWNGEEPELFTLASLAAQRDMSVKYSTAKPEVVPKPAVEEIKVSIGTKLKHKKFGLGVVLSVNRGIAKIMFSDGHGVKSIVLATAFNNGILSADIS